MNNGKYDEEVGCSNFEYFFLMINNLRWIWLIYRHIVMIIIIKWRSIFHTVYHFWDQ